jgi:putative membrane protein
MPFIVRWLLNTVALAIVAWLLPGMRISGVLSALLAGAVIGWVNAVVRPILLVLTLPLTIASFGIFALVLNGLLLLVASWVVPGFEVAGIWTAIGGALLLTLVSWILSSLLGGGQDQGGTRRTFIWYQRRGKGPSNQGEAPKSGDGVIDLKQDEQGKWR